MSADRKTPAFSFYATDFLVGTVTLSLAARGAYITLLAYEWDHGSIPDDPAARARVLGCARRESDTTWARICDKFFQGTDGLWRNARLEAERLKQSARRAALTENGTKGGRPRKPDENQKDKQTETNSFPSGSANENQNESLSSSSSDLLPKEQGEDVRTSTGAARQPVENAKTKPQDPTPATFALACVVMREALKSAATLDADTSLGNVAEHFKQLCAGHHLAYDRDVVRKAYDAVTVADQRRV